MYALRIDSAVPRAMPSGRAFGGAARSANACVGGDISARASGRLRLDEDRAAIGLGHRLGHGLTPPTGSAIAGRATAAALTAGGRHVDARSPAAVGQAADRAGHTARSSRPGLVSAVAPLPCRRIAGEAGRSRGSLVLQHAARVACESEHATAFDISGRAGRG